MLHKHGPRAVLSLEQGLTILFIFNFYYDHFQLPGLFLVSVDVVIQFTCFMLASYCTKNK